MRVLYMVVGWIALMLASAGIDAVIVGLWTRDFGLAGFGAAWFAALALVAAFFGRLVGWDRFIRLGLPEAAGQPKQPSGG